MNDDKDAPTYNKKSTKMTGAKIVQKYFEQKGYDDKIRPPFQQWHRIQRPPPVIIVAKTATGGRSGRE